MKLRTRILLISAVAFLIASLVSNFMIWRICQKQLVDIAIQNTYTKAYAVTSDFSHLAETLNGKIDRVSASYFFQSEQDDYTVCACGTEEYYNHTVFSAGYLELQSGKKTIDSSGFQYAMFEWAGKPIVCIYSTISGSTSQIRLYHVADLSGTYRQMERLGLEMLGISVLVILLVAAFLYFIIRRSFRPLGELAEKAKLIADGKYDEQISYQAPDEVGLLANEFNKMAASVQNHTREIEESETRKTLFMGSLTHELKTPLTAISGYAQTLRKVKLSPEDTEEALYYMEQECGRLSRLSRKIMNLLRLEQEETVISMTSVSVSKLFSAAICACTPTANEKKIDILAGDTREALFCDADLMTEVLVNLIENAVKASPEASEIQLYTEVAEQGGFSIVVQDFGCGIAKDELDRIFEPFYMSDRSRSRKSGGAGLGLAISAAILAKHGFQFSVESTVGAGTKMKIICFSQPVS